MTFEQLQKHAMDTKRQQDSAIRAGLQLQKRIKEYLDAGGGSDLAKRLGVSPQYVANIKNGHRPVTPQFVYHLINGRKK